MRSQKNENEKRMPLVCEMIYTVQNSRHKELKISENQQLDFLRVRDIITKGKPAGQE